VYVRGGQFGVVHFPGTIVAGFQLGDAGGVDVKTDGVHMLAKGNGNRQAHIAQANNRDGASVCHGGYPGILPPARAGGHEPTT
jgi:hypothetical protein